ncbi:MAG: L-2-amino-thiazoline-4-carboxylic acid hydrolase [Mycobacterium sp.]|nr:L-2-amino-thiazoline-4-carboxylic acid hydrolase [Mycobacterium sp.]
MAELKEDPDYYVRHREAFLKDFDKQSPPFAKILEDHFPGESERIVAQAREEFAALLPDLPYIGGGMNPMTEYLVGSAIVLGYYKVLSGKGMTDEQVGQFCYQVSAHRFDDDSRIYRWFAKEVGFGKLYWQYVARYATSHPYEGGWDCEIVEGNGYDWGIDITRCGVCKLYDAQGAGEFTKWACPSDFAMTKSLHIGMRRTQTLSAGDPRCDFRFKSDWVPEDDWPPAFTRCPDSEGQ